MTQVAIFFFKDQTHDPEKQHASTCSLLVILAKQSSSMLTGLVPPNYIHTNPLWP
jgi:hypothetical protein